MISIGMGLVVALGVSIGGFGCASQTVHSRPDVPYKSVARSAHAGTTGSVLTGPPAKICGSPTLSGPSTPPPGAVRVPAGDDFLLLGENWVVHPGTIYWFAPGVHTLGLGQFQQIQPQHGDTFVGAPGAVLDGQRSNATAFAGKATDVTIEDLTIENFVPQGGQYAVNHDMGANWRVEHDTVQDNGDTRGSELGAGLGMGSGDVYEYNCITHNGEYALNAGGAGTVFAYNEVSWNGISYFPDDSCGCSGGIKYWAATDATIADNYIHDNYNVGLWADTDNSGFLISDNYISDNWAEGMIYEISYNADITGNQFVDNGWGTGSAGAGGIPYGDALYVASSGGNPAVKGNYSGKFLINHNTFTDNWDGLIIYQNPNRLCGSAANSSAGYCTMVNGSLFTTRTCAADELNSAPSAHPDYFDGCQWKAGNITVSANTFNFDPKDIVTAAPPLPREVLSRCPTTNLTNTNTNIYWCGFNGMFSLPGSEASGPGAGWTVADAIMDLRGPSGEAPDNNVWMDNSYVGPWAFQAYAQGASSVQTDIFHSGVPTTLSFTGWQHTWDQDVGSTWRPSPAPTSPVG